MSCGEFGGYLCCGDSKKGSAVAAADETVSVVQTDGQEVKTAAEDLVRAAHPVPGMNEEGWNDPEREANTEEKLKGSLRSTAASHIQSTVVRKAMSSFSLGSGTSGGGSSKVSSNSPGILGQKINGPAPGRGGANTTASRWSKLFDMGAGSALQKVTQEPLKDDERMLTFDESSVHAVCDPKTINAKNRGHPNRIRTTKFTWITWLPKSLVYQFQRIANIYFLFIAVLVCFEWSPKNWRSKIFPFIFVLLWTALKDLYEDMRRRRDDDAENSQTVKRLKRGKVDGHRQQNEVDDFEEVRWDAVVAGDILLIQEDSAFPADMLLLHPAGDEEAFISTVMLDGETSLKNRQAPSICQVLSQKCAKDGGMTWQAAQSAQSVDGKAFPFESLKAEIVRFIKLLRRPGVEIKFPTPTPVLSDVRGYLQPMGNAEEALICPFTEDNFLPRGCVLRNTPWVIGFAVYVGSDTKTRLNASMSNLKFSNMQVNLNNCVRGLLVVLFALCLVATIISFAGEGGIAADEDELIEAARQPHIRFFMFCITFYHVVPLSLYVMYEMIKLLLAYQVNYDKSMYDPVRDVMAQARTAEIIEEMGQVDFIFSDKTGTLTANEMIFARCHVAGQDLGEFRPNADGTEGDGVLKAQKALASGKEISKDSLFEPVLNLFTCLSVCHSVQVTVKDDEPIYSGMSPDEVALVQVAHDVGSSFRSRVRKHAGNTSEVTLKGPSDSERKFTVLHELAFTSDRKRMSVLVRHKGAVWCITKGADSVMEGLMKEPFSEGCNRDLLKFSKQGLRTLVVGMKIIDRGEFELWDAEYTTARNIIDETKDARMAEVAARIETGLKFIGVTAVEDKLQEGVPETIETVKQAGIRVWVLTGDKTETAVDIARSCKLFTDDTCMAYAVLSKDAKDAETKLLEAHQKLDGKGDTGLVLDGQTLLHALESQECRKIIYDLGIVSRSCICSRLSPMQKLALVKLVREQNKKSITLAIGDGANDVPMIQGAHLGIAIRGKEGTQAVQASDVAISYFRFLVPLLLCHGRRGYRRVAIFLCFYLYKNVALLMSDVIWMILDKFRARIAFPEYLSIGFNVIYVTWHLWFVIGLDKDLKDDVACRKPELYHVGPARKLFNARIFSLWMLRGVIHGAIAFSIPFAMIGTTEYNKTEPSQFWVCSTVVFTAVVFVVNLKLVLCSENPLSLRITWLPTIGAFLSYFFALTCLSYTSLGKAFQPTMYHVPGMVMESSDAMMAFVAAVAAALAMDVIEKATVYFVCPSKLQLAQREKGASKYK